MINYDVAAYHGDKFGPCDQAHVAYFDNVIFWRPTCCASTESRILHRRRARRAIALGLEATVRGQTGNALHRRLPRKVDIGWDFPVLRQARIRNRSGSRPAESRSGRKG